MKGTKKEAIPLATMESILGVVLDKDNYPLMIHCNHGKHRTGCVVAVIRKISGWDTTCALDEYKAYAEPKARDCDLEYIGAFQVSDLHSIQRPTPRRPRTSMENRTFFRALLFSFMVLVLWAFSSRSMGDVVAESHRLL